MRFDKDRLLSMGFYGGLTLKAVNALIEMIGGFIMLVINYDWLNAMIKAIALPELSEDSKDIVMNYLLTLSQNTSITTMHSVALYMLLHGVTKLVAIGLLWKKKLWAYLPVVFVFGLFIAYECYSYLHSHSSLMLAIIIIDVAIVVVVLLEYKQLKNLDKREGGPSYEQVESNRPDDECRQN